MFLSTAAISMGNVDLLCTLFLLATWTGGAMLGGFAGLWARPAVLGFLVGAAAGAGIAMLLVAILTWSKVFAGSEPKDLVLLLLPPALMAGLMAASIRETIELDRQAWKKRFADIANRTLLVPFCAKNVPPSSKAIRQAPSRENDQVD
jgi:hypothetical protein